MKMFSDSPCQLNFRLLATRRFVLDNERVMSEFVPGTVLRQSLQNRVMPYCKTPPTIALANGVATLSAPSDALAEGVLFVGGFFPGVHFSADFETLSPGAAALLEMAPLDGSLRLRVRAVPGCPVEFTETRHDGHSTSDSRQSTTDIRHSTLDFRLSTGASAPVVPAPPFRLSAVVAGPTILLVAHKDGEVRFLGSVTLDESPENDVRRRDFAGVLKCAAGASLPPEGTARLSRAAVALSAGVGQADFCIVTDGPGSKPYIENGRMFCTFSARAGMKYVKSVASFDPAVFDFRMEGILLTNYGDDDPLLRNDAVDHLFRDADGTWKAVAIGWSETAHNLDPSTRKGSGLVVCETRENPLHGIHVLRARPLVVGDGIKSEDPHLRFDTAAGKWRLSTSSFTPQGLRARLWESDRWDGPYTPLAGPVAFDSTGCQMMDFGDQTFVMTASVDGRHPVYAYPSLEYVGEWRCDMALTNDDCSNGRVFTAWAEAPEGCPWRYVMLAMDRQNFPGMPTPNWTYGGIYFYVAT